MAVRYGRCALHQVQLRKRIPSATQRGYGVQWRRIVAQRIAEQPWCSRCLTSGSDRNPLTGDHIVPVSRGGQTDVANCQVLCRSCNSRKGAR